MTKRLKLTATVLASTLVMAMSGSAMADGAALFTAKGCTGCHGVGGVKPIMPAYPKVAGQGKEYIIQQMTDIKSGARNNGQTAAMKGIMASVSEDEIKELAEYLSAL